MKRCLALLFALVVLLCGCSIGPKNVTRALNEPPSPSPATQAGLSGSGFSVKSRHVFPLEKLDPDSVKPETAQGVVDWLDNDQLFALSCTAGENQGEIISELCSINYQFGFQNPVRVLDEGVPEFITLNHKKDTVSYQLENDDVGKYSVMYHLAAMRNIFEIDHYRVRSLPVWSPDDRHLGLAAYVNGRYTTTLLDTMLGGEQALEEGSQQGVSVLDINEGGRVLIRRVIDERMYSLEILNPSDGSSNAIYTGGVNAAWLLGDDSALVHVGEELRITGQGVIESYIKAVAFSGDRQYVAFAQTNLDGSMDVYVGQWSGSKIINKQLVHKGIDFDVQRLLFSPDTNKLYTEGLRAGGSKYAVVFEFA